MTALFPRSTLSLSPSRLCWLSVAAIGYRGLRGTLAVRRSLAWLNDDGRDRPTSRHGPNFVLVLPLLREQRVIAQTVAAFSALARSHPNTSVVLVTTERERAERTRASVLIPVLAGALAERVPTAHILDRFLGVLPRDRLERLVGVAAGGAYDQCLAAARAAFHELPATEDLARDLSAQAAADGVDVRHYHWPRSQGTMAHQINYAGTAELDRLSREGIESASVYLGVYNADSRPEASTLAQVARTIERLASRPGGPPRVLQQSALFTANLEALCGGRGGSLLAGAALLQTRWSLAHELPLWRRQSRQARSVRTPGGWPRLAHCTGHGLFVRGDEFTRWSGLPTESTNEDLAFGFLLSAAQVPIDPVPALEWADSPETVGQLLRQKRQWFWSYVEYPHCVRMAARRGLGDRRTRWGLAAQGLARGLCWLGTSPAVAATVALPLVDRRRRAAVAAAAALTVYGIAPFRLIAAELRRCGQRRCGLRMREVVGGLAAYLTHSLGPVWCVASALRRASTGARYAHGKTER